MYIDVSPRLKYIWFLRLSFWTNIYQRWIYRCFSFWCCQFYVCLPYIREFDVSWLFQCGFHANNVDFMQIRWNMLNKPTYEWITKVYDHSIVFLKRSLTLNLFTKTRVKNFFDTISTLTSEVHSVFHQRRFKVKRRFYQLPVAAVSPLSFAI